MLKPAGIARNAKMPLSKETQDPRFSNTHRYRSGRDRLPSPISTTPLTISAKDLLWNRLEGRQLGGFRFHRALRIPPYIVDVVCLGRNLIVEVVLDEPRDETFTCSLKDGGYRIVRFQERDVLEKTEAVLQAILKALAEQRRR
jgi:very-short-patch-repair endonuclease